jgi:hypothetical protein
MLVFLTILLKGIFVAERNSADNLSIGIQYIVLTLKCFSMKAINKEIKEMGTLTKLSKETNKERKQRDI